MQNTANLSESVKLGDNPNNIRQGSLTCRGRYELEVGVDPAKKRTISLSAYAKHSYSASLMDSGGWKIYFKKNPQEIKIVCQTIGESLEHMTKGEAVRLRGVIERDLKEQFKVMLARRFKEQGVPVPDFLQNEVKVGDASNTS